MTRREGTKAPSWASSPATRSVMCGNKGRATRPELALRSAVHRLGPRYRVEVRPIPRVRRTADLVFTRVNVAVFVDGCFWHGCAQHHRPARANADFWLRKIAGSKARDVETDTLIAGDGWQVIRTWEHEDPIEAARRVATAVRASTPQTRNQRPSDEGPSS